jgi:hypothetical protein
MVNALNLRSIRGAKATKSGPSWASPVELGATCRPGRAAAVDKASVSVSYKPVLGGQPDLRGSLCHILYQLMAKLVSHFMSSTMSQGHL